MRTQSHGVATIEEQRAVRVLLVLLLVGAGVRWLESGAGRAGGATVRAPAGLARPVRDSVRARAERQGRPLRRGERIDVDRAEVTELTRLPGIGPRLAQRIVEDRAIHGAFGSPAGLGRVPGIGPVLVERLGPHLAFSARVRSGARGQSSPQGRGRVSLNRATAAELERLPGIGPARARAIVEDRHRRGPFASVDQLVRVPGIGPAVVARIRGRVRVP